MHMKLILIVYACMHWYNWLGFFKIKSEAFNSQSLYCHSQWKVDKVRVLKMMKIRHCKWCPAYCRSATALRTQESCYQDNHNLAAVYVCVAKFSIPYCRWFFALFIQNKTSSSIDQVVFPHYLWHKTSPITYGRLLLTKFENIKIFSVTSI